MNDTYPSLSPRVSQAVERIRHINLPVEPDAKLDRLALAARLLGGNRRRTSRLPVRKRAMITINGLCHGSATIDISEHGFMLDRPAGMMDDVTHDVKDLAQSPARVTIEQLGMLEGELVGWTRKTLSFRVTNRQDDLADARKTALISALQRQAMRDISRTTQFAAEIAFAFMRAVIHRKVSLAQLCSHELVAEKGTDPAQFEHPAQDWFNANMPQIMARHVCPDTDMAYAVATDRNGFVPVHQPQFSRAQRAGDILFNHSFSRHRRIYDDRWTLIATRFSARPLIQARQRDMPEGLGALVRNVSAPINVMNRHWGAAQIGTIMDGPT